MITKRRASIARSSFGIVAVFGIAPLALSPLILVSVAAAAPNEADVYQVGNTLCTTPAFAIAYTNERNAGQPPEMAIDIVGKRAGDRVCGFYAGQAFVLEQKVVTQGGFYRLTGWCFVKDSRIAWVAETMFTPVHAASSI